MNASAVDSQAVENLSSDVDSCRWNRPSSTPAWPTDKRSRAMHSGATVRRQPAYRLSTGFQQPVDRPNRRDALH